MTKIFEPVTRITLASRCHKAVGHHFGDGFFQAAVIVSGDQVNAGQTTLF